MIDINQRLNQIISELKDRSIAFPISHSQDCMYGSIGLTPAEECRCYCYEKWWVANGVLKWLEMQMDTGKVQDDS